MTTMHARRDFLRQLSALGALAAGGLLPGRARAGAPPKVQILGDSMIAGAIGLLFVELFEQRYGCTVERRGKVSSGLARPDFYDWIEAGAKAHAEFEPEVVLCMFGGNDGQGLYMGKDRRGEAQWIRYGDPGWDREYVRRINAFADAVAPTDQWLFWIGMPQMRLPKLHERVGHLNALFETEMAIRPHGRYLDVWSLLADRRGNYTDKLMVRGKKAKIRAADGVHLTRWGGQAVVDGLEPFIADTLDLAPVVTDASVER